MEYSKQPRIISLIILVILLGGVIVYQEFGGVERKTASVVSPQTGTLYEDNPRGFSVIVPPGYEMHNGSIWDPISYRHTLENVNSVEAPEVGIIVAPLGDKTIERYAREKFGAVGFDYTKDGNEFNNLKHVQVNGREYVRIIGDDLHTVLSYFTEHNGRVYEFTQQTGVGDDNKVNVSHEDIVIKVLNSLHFGQATIRLLDLSLTLPKGWVLQSTEKDLSDQNIWENAKIAVPDVRYKVVAPLQIEKSSTRITDHELLRQTSSGVKIYRQGCAPGDCFLMVINGRTYAAEFAPAESDQPPPPNLDGVWFPDSSVTTDDRLNFLVSVK